MDNNRAWKAIAWGIALGIVGAWLYDRWKRTRGAGGVVRRVQQLVAGPKDGVEYMTGVAANSAQCGCQPCRC
jgi:hypothetical protein